MGRGGELRRVQLAFAGGSRRQVRGVSVGGVLVIVGIILLLTWSAWLGLSVILLGQLIFGGFLTGRWS